ncbi:MAG: hypothetical protein EAX86_10740 [Candidatus Heimdallarchaeota archaeon]|nr:hypothetical protein [Candidatus Heimdallarchaeota archaeon]
MKSNKLHTRKSLAQLIVFFFFIQLLFNSTLITPQTSSASPLTYWDSVWEGAVTSNDNFNTPWIFTINESLTNNPATPLNVSTLHPDYYSFRVAPGFYFQVYIELNESNAWNETSRQLIVPLQPEDSKFTAAINLQLLYPDGTLIEESRAGGSEELVGPILTTESIDIIINVSVVNPIFSGIYSTVPYSTTYNMSIIYEDKYERLQSNDKQSYINIYDDEIVPGTYENMRLSGDTYTEYGNIDIYSIFLYADTWMNITISAFGANGVPSQAGPDIILYNHDLSAKEYDFIDGGDGSPTTEVCKFTMGNSGWFYLYIDGTNHGGQHTKTYNLYIDMEDQIEVNNGENSTIDDRILALGTQTRVISRDDSDSYNLSITAQQRLLVEIYWFSFIGDLTLKVYENYSIQSFIAEDKPIPIGPDKSAGRVGPHRAQSTSVYYLNITSDNPEPRYYNLSIRLLDADDWAEDNNGPNTAYLLSPTSRTYAPTLADPFAGLYSLKGDQDWFAIPLLSGDNITIRIDFDDALADLNLGLYTQEGTTLDLSLGITGDFEEVTHLVRKADVYLFVIVGASYNGVGVDYNLTVAIDAFDDDYESNNFPVEAKPIGEGHHDDLILRDGSDDWYYVYLIETDVISVNLSYFAQETDGELNDIDLSLFYPDESLAERNITSFNESITFTADITGRYYINLIIFGEANAYNLTIDIIETDDPWEDNDFLGEASQFNINPIPGQAISRMESGLRMRVKDDDFYVVNVPAGSAILIRLSFPQGQNLDLQLLAGTGTIFDTSDLTLGNTEEVGPFPMNSSYYTVYNTTNIFFRVYMNQGLTTDYELNVTIGPEELLITRQTAITGSSTTTTKAFNPWGFVGPALVIGGAVGGGAAILYAGKKTGALDTVVDKFKDRFSGRGSGGTGDKKKIIGRKKPPS